MHLKPILKKIWLLGLPICFTVCFYFSFLSRCAAPSHYDRPPLLVVNGITYKGSSQKIAQLPPDSVYLGSVLSSVPSGESPTENFQANDERIGASIYQVGDDIAVFSSDKWWIYKEVD